ncbi:Protein canopy -like protein 3 [Halotydeus destructor]|nr:Protein canopy -like protein 3 [Halotydeus destructor]
MLLKCVLLSLHILITLAEEKTVEDEKYGVRYATDCEVCKYTAIELADKLEETGKTDDVVETGYHYIDTSRKKKKYKFSELRLVESMEGVCDRLLQYNMHKERTDSSRFAKGMSQTFQTLHGLVNKGVKVDLGIPEQLWDKPSAEISHLKTQCEHLIEKYEDDIENWYFQSQEKPLYEYLCVDRALKNGDSQCIFEKPATDDKPAKGDKVDDLAEEKREHSTEEL